jgi:hypothetical protein
VKLEDIIQEKKESKRVQPSPRAVRLTHENEAWLLEAVKRYAVTPNLLFNLLIEKERREEAK